MSEALTIGPILVILTMAAVTYFWRISGFVTMGLFTMTPRLKRGLEALPGAVVMSTVVPLIAKTGTVAALAVGLAVIVMVVTRREYLAVVAGIAAAAGARAVM